MSERSFKKKSKDEVERDPGWDEYFTSNRSTGELLLRGKGLAEIANQWKDDAGNLGRNTEREPLRNFLHTCVQNSARGIQSGIFGSLDDFTPHSPMLRFCIRVCQI